MSIKIKVGKKSQIVIPVCFRKIVGIKEGDEIVMDVVDNTVVIYPKPPSFTHKLRGLHKDIWEGIDPKEYVKSERESW